MSYLVSWVVSEILDVWHLFSCLLSIFPLFLFLVSYFLCLPKWYRHLNCIEICDIKWEFLPIHIWHPPLFQSYLPSQKTIVDNLVCISWLEDGLGEGDTIVPVLFCCLFIFRHKNVVFWEGSYIVVVVKDVWPFYNLILSVI